MLNVHAVLACTYVHTYMHGWTLLTQSHFMYVECNVLFTLYCYTTAAVLFRCFNQLIVCFFFPVWLAIVCRIQCAVNPCIVYAPLCSARLWYICCLRYSMQYGIYKVHFIQSLCISYYSFPSHLLAGDIT